MDEDPTMRTLFRTEARQFAHVLGEGADAARRDDGDLEVRLVILSPEIRSWSGMQVTLQNQITVGAYAVIKQTDGSRWLYTTTRGRAQEATLIRWSKKPITLFTAANFDELLPVLERSFLNAMRNATEDGRSRRATARGFDPHQATIQRDLNRRFRSVADGSKHLTADELDAYLSWWDEEIDPRIKRMLGGLPVDQYIHDMAKANGAATRWSLVSTRHDPHNTRP